MVTYMPIYTWVKGGKHLTVLLLKGEHYVPQIKAWLKIISPALLQVSGSRAELHVTPSVCHGPLSQCEDWLPCLQKENSYPCMCHTWQRGRIPAFTSYVGWMPSHRVELCSLAQRTSTTIPPSAPSHTFTARSAHPRCMHSVSSPVLLYFVNKEGATSPPPLTLYYLCNWDLSSGYRFRQASVFRKSQAM